MRQLAITCAEVASPKATWVETYTEGAKYNGFPDGHEDPERWGRELVQRFNDTLRANEKPRMVVKVDITEVPEAEAKKVERAHEWEKTNLVTIMKGGRSYDTARCQKCGATSKRFGVGGYTLDTKFKKLISCPKG